MDLPAALIWQNESSFGLTAIGSALAMSLMEIAQKCGVDLDGGNNEEAMLVVLRRAGIDEKNCTCYRTVIFIFEACAKRRLEMKLGA